MTKIITNGKKPFLAVPVNGQSDEKLKFILEFSMVIDLNLSIFGKLSELTEEQAGELVVKRDFKTFSMFLGKHPVLENTGQLYETAIEALRSLLKSNDCWLKEWCIPELVICWDAAKYNRAAEDFLIILIE